VAVAVVVVAGAVAGVAVENRNKTPNNELTRRTMPSTQENRKQKTRTQREP
jgi:hypothetical protein